MPVEVSGDEEGRGGAELTALYRAAQEAVTNACRHARASQVTVAVRLAGGAARLEVTDDGRGFAPEATAAGFGLLGMRERVHLVPTNVDVESSPGAGTRVTVTVPRGTTAKFSVDGGGDMNDEEPDQAAPVRVLVVDDQRLIRDGIALPAFHPAGHRGRRHRRGRPGRGGADSGDGAGRRAHGCPDAGDGRCRGGRRPA
ncbi:sensor histidine kinase [Streptomyces sp. NPDC050164]|uniref:sensor histidine kinase n=1 Tax=Streptomyces sp. NPDC050164 TaxID=3365605 RepID=UPI00379F4BCE